jgi:hypothetical protein
MRMGKAKHFFGDIRAAAAFTRAAGSAREFTQAAYAFGDGLLDHLLGDGIADTDVHGEPGMALTGHIQLQMRMIVNYLHPKRSPRATR